MRNLLILLIVVILVSCSGNTINNIEFPELLEELDAQLKVLVQEIPEDKVPRSYSEENGYRMVDYNDWTCGFPAGSFWLMYELTEDDYWKNVAIENTEKLDGVQYLTNTHDLGFMVFCSYGNGYRLTQNEEYKEIIIQASESLITRFNPTVGAIKSWDNDNWQYPVIIDNMMNLEMLFWASEVTGDPKYRNVAVSHADVTIENHFMDDMSAYHVISFDTITGKPLEKVTHQGFDNTSKWGRGQAWGLYGFMMTYRETGEEKYLEIAEEMGKMIIGNLPDDMISYWDYDDPQIPDTERDASAAAITSAALFELSTYSDDGPTYLQAANEILDGLTSSEYRATNGENGGFILMHSVGNKPAGSEIDVAINYADYYYIQALKQQQNLQN